MLKMTGEKLAIAETGAIASNVTSESMHPLPAAIRPLRISYYLAGISIGNGTKKCGRLHS